MAVLCIDGNGDGVLTVFYMWFLNAFNVRFGHGRRLTAFGSLDVNEVLMQLLPSREEALNADTNRQAVRLLSKMI